MEEATAPLCCLLTCTTAAGLVMSVASCNEPGDDATFSILKLFAIEVAADRDKRVFLRLLADVVEALSAVRILLILVLPQL